MKRKRGTRLLTSAIPELGFVRVSVQRTGGKLHVAEAAAVLGGMLKALGKKHAFLPDTRSSSAKWPDWCGGAGRTTDAHLLMLAEQHGAELAALDLGIPGAFVIPC
jgi:predicted nucleic acid-binding protein